MLTYGYGVSDVDIKKLILCHQNSSNLATLTAVQPPDRFGALNLKGSQVLSFQEKQEGEGGWVNGGFFVLKPKIFDYLTGEGSSFEIDALPKVASLGKLGAYLHKGYWQPVDTIRDLQRLEEALERGELPWI